MKILNDFVKIISKFFWLYFSIRFKIGHVSAEHYKKHHSHDFESDRNGLLGLMHVLLEKKIDFFTLRSIVDIFWIKQRSFVKIWLFISNEIVKIYLQSVFQKYLQKTSTLAWFFHLKLGELKKRFQDAKPLSGIFWSFLLFSQNLENNFKPF